MTSDQFFARVDMRGPVPEGLISRCWIWRGGKGYGAVRFNGAVLRPHRLAWILTHGPIRKRRGYHGTCIRHRCDTPRCVNPAHLLEGTHRDNMRDKVARGRQARGELLAGPKRGDGNPSRRHPERLARGEKHGRSELTDSEVVALRAMRKDKGTTFALLGERFGIAPSTAAGICRGETWKHLLAGA